MVKQSRQSSLHSKARVTGQKRDLHSFIILDMDKKDNEIVDGEREDGDEKAPDRSDSRDER